MVVTGCEVGVLGSGGDVLGGVDGWVSEFWTSDKSPYVNTHYKHENSALNSIWPKSGLSELEKHSSNL